MAPCLPVLPLGILVLDSTKLNKPRRWKEFTSIGRIAYEAKAKPREWVTLYQRSGISLQINPTYYDFRLWVFTPYGNVSVNLDKGKVMEFAKALGLARFLISNVPSHEGAFKAPSRVKFEPRYTEGEKRYAARQVNRHLTGRRVHKANKAGVGEPKP